jgi:pSer/pThr/pTyr-binding forkhead associated (FHA) protein
MKEEFQPMKALTIKTEEPLKDPCQKTTRTGTHLDVLIRRDNGRGFPILDEIVIIGCNYDCDIRIEKPDVSRVHAVVCRENGCLVLEDLGGRNGTRVNQVAVSRKVLVDGDRIQIGRAELVFNYG